MKKLMFLVGIFIFADSWLIAKNHHEEICIVDEQASFGTLSDACTATKAIGKHATLVGWNLVKIPFIPLKHFILQIVDVFRAAKGTIKHSILVGYSFIRLGGNLIAIPLIQGYEHPQEAALFIAALLAAGGAYEGYILAQDLDPEVWDSIIQSFNVFS